VLALNSHRNLGMVGVQKERASQRLSSGYRVNSAADDAAGLAISEKMRAQIRGLDMAHKNTQDAISLIQTAEGGMQEIDNMVHRIRELIVYASNDTAEANSLGTGDRQKIQDEINQLVQEIDKMAERVEFNKKKLINGSYEATPKDDTVVSDWINARRTLVDTQDALADARREYEIAAKGAQSARDAIGNLLADSDAAAAMRQLAGKSGVGSAVNALNNVLKQLKNLTTEEQWSAFVNGGYAEAVGDGFTFGPGVWEDGKLVPGTGNRVSISALGKLVSAVTQRAQNETTGMPQSGWTAMEVAQWAVVDALFNGALMNVGNAVQTAYASLESKAMALTSAIRSYGSAVGEMAYKQAVYDSSEKTAGLYFQTGSNAMQGFEISIGSIKSNKLGIGSGDGISLISVLPESGTNITNQLDILDTALSYVTTERAKLGSAQNRLEFASNSLQVSSENLSAAESRIRNADMGKEMMTLTQANILQQAAISMLTQANQQPQSILQLLQ